MIKKSKQINKGTVKGQTDKADIKKKVVSKPVVYECLVCRKRVIATERPTECACSQACYVVNKSYEVV